VSAVRKNFSYKTVLTAYGGILGNHLVGLQLNAVVFFYRCFDCGNSALF
jgi:hypothetical protein